MSTNKSFSTETSERYSRALFEVANEINELDKVKRLKLINSITGVKSANLIGTKSNDGITNLAIFSSVVHLGSKPPLLGFITRTSQKVKRNTLENIISTKKYTINQIQKELKIGQIIVDKKGSIWRWDGFVSEDNLQKKNINYKNRPIKIYSFQKLEAWQPLYLQCQKSTH